MSTTCYLCGKEITVNQTNDHVVPKLLIDRAQPKVKGFDYGGSLPTHQTCNNNFGSEEFCRKALIIISKLIDPGCISVCKHKETSQNIMMMNSECFDEFSNKELIFFKIKDTRNESCDEIIEPKVISELQPANFKETVLFTTLAVITKSSAALLLKNFLDIVIPSHWNILAIPYHRVEEELNFGEILGKVKIFDKDVKIYIKDLNAGTYLVRYHAHGIILYIFFNISGNSKVLKKIASKFPEADHYYFEGECINDLKDYQWKNL